jgi:hypothetical protein
VITQELVREHFEYRDGILFWKKRNGRRGKIGDVAGSRENTGYWRICFRRRRIVRSRLVWIYHNGDIPNGLDIDHINRVRNDDRIENLRLVTRRQNAQNMTTQSKCGVGVHFHRNRYFAYIWFGNDKQHLGCYSSKEEASAAYWKAVDETREEI